ncbi:MAG: FAD-binding oxidoreductase [Gammaproteobacteria bacterium]|nr:MAG: FAD-binding oxidoreductase [Gammaproteobacteria bacterium]
MSSRAALPASWYEASVTRPPPVPALAGSIEADVCVIGGGIAGCSTALHLAERGFRVVLLEAGRIGSGASGRSGAQLLPGYACGQDKLSAELGAADARRLWDFTLEGLDLLRERIARHAIDCDLVHGQMHCAIKPRQREELLAWQREFEDDYGYASTRIVGRQELSGLLATRRYCAGLLDTNGGHCHPLKYTLGLARAAGAAGVALHEGSPVTAIARGSLVTVQTATGSVRARYAVLCGNVGNIGLERMLARKLIGVMTYIIATEPLGADRATALITNNMAVTDINWVLDYFRRSADHRLLFGGRVSYSGVDPAGTARATRARMLKVYPQLAEAAIEYAWGGEVDITMSRAPHFGRLDPNLYFLQGFSGHGMVLTGMAGRLVAEAIAGQAERFDLYGRLRHRDFPGGQALRRPALVLAMLWYRLRDLL